MINHRVQGKVDPQGHMETTSPRFNSNAASIFQFSPPVRSAHPHAQRSAPTCRRLRRPHVTCGAPAQSSASAGQEKSMRAANGAVIGNARPVLRHPRDSVHPDFYTARAVRDIPFKTPRKIGALHRRRSISHAGKADIMLGRAPQKQKRRLRPPRGGFLPAVKRSPRPHEVPRRDCRKFTEKFFRII